MAMSRVQNVPVMEGFELHSYCYNNENNENYNRNDHDVNDDNIVEDDNWQYLSFQCPRYSGQPWEVPGGGPARGASSQLPSRPGQDYEYSHCISEGDFIYTFLQCLTEGITVLILRR